MRERQTAIPLSFIFILTLLMLIAAPAYAAVSTSAAAPSPAPENHNVNGGFTGRKSAAPDIRSIYTLDDLVKWHNTPAGFNVFFVLGEDVIVNRKITLDETSEAKELGAIEHIIRITAGGSLILDHSKLNIQGPGPVIVVEPGGQLLLKAGAIYTAPSADSIVVEKGGKLIQSEEFHIEGKVLDKNVPLVEPDPEPDLKPLPPAQVEKPNPPVLPAIKNIFEPNTSIVCMVGEPPALSEYPAACLIIYEEAPNVPVQKELSIKWELDTVDFDTAGTYQVKGVITADALAANGLSNPKGITSTLQLTVLKWGPLDTLTGNVLSVESNGRCLIRLALPPLPEGVTALYVYRSADGKNWRKAVGQVYVDGSYDNFLPYAQATPKALYVAYRYQTDYRPIWLRVEVAGSAVEGVSNEIRLDMPASAKPGEGIHTGETGDDGGSGGNRGGGGQSEGGREHISAQEKPEWGAATSSSNKIPSAVKDTPPILTGQAPSRPSTGQTIGGQTKGGKKPKSTAAQEKESGNNPSVSAPSDSGQEDWEEMDSLEAAVQELSDQTQGDPPTKRSRGVLLTGGATAIAAAGLVLLKKINKNRKRKP